MIELAPIPREAMRRFGQAQPWGNEKWRIGFDHAARQRGLDLERMSLNQAGEGYIAVLWGGDDSVRWEMDQLLNEIRGRGLAGRLLLDSDTQVSASGAIRHAGEALPAPSAVIPRAVNPEGWAVLDRLEAAGVPVVNSGRSIAIARDKHLTTSVLEAAGVPTPESRKATDLKSLQEHVAGYGGTAIVKLSDGSGGRNVHLVRTPDEAEQIGRMYLRRNGSTSVVVQPYHEQSFGRMVRALVREDPDGQYRVFGAVERVAPEGEIRANRGTDVVRRRIDPSGETPPLTPEAARTAEQAAEATGLRLAGVDLIPSPHGWRALEVNPSPYPVETDVPLLRDEQVFKNYVDIAERMAAATRS